MNSELLLNEALGYLRELDQLFADLASRSEHQVQRKDYLDYQGQIQQMQKNSARILIIMTTLKPSLCLWTDGRRSNSNVSLL